MIVIGLPRILLFATVALAGCSGEPTPKTPADRAALCTSKQSKVEDTSGRKCACVCGGGKPSMCVPKSTPIEPPTEAS